MLIFCLTLLLFRSINSTYSNIRPEVINGQKIEFSWWPNETVTSQEEATKFCNSKQAHLPYSENLKYFFKKLPFGILKNKKEMRFYLSDVLESTIDYPRSESGEKMCLIVKKSTTNEVIVERINASSSCTASVDIIVCSTSPDRLYENKAHEYRKPKDKLEICFKPEVFYIIVGISIGLLVILLIINLILCYKNRVKHSSLMIPKLPKPSKYDDSDFLQLISPKQLKNYSHFNSVDRKSDMKSRKSSTNDSRIICRHDFE